MTTPSRSRREHEGVECHRGFDTLSPVSCKSQRLSDGNDLNYRNSGNLITVSGCSVCLPIEAARALGVPRRQLFAWRESALEYARRLAAEHGWPIEIRAD